MTSTLASKTKGHNVHYWKEGRFHSEQQTANSQPLANKQLPETSAGNKTDLQFPDLSGLTAFSVLQHFSEDRSANQRNSWVSKFNLQNILGAEFGSVAGGFLCVTPININGNCSTALKIYPISFSKL